MALLLHASATTTARLRTQFQASAEPTVVLVRYGVNPKSVAKWGQRQSVGHLPPGAAAPRISVLSELEEAAVIAFRAQTRLPLDDVFVALRPAIPRLTRGSLHRCLQRHGISRLPRPARQHRG